MSVAGGNQAETKSGDVVHNVCIYLFYINLRFYKLILFTFLANTLLKLSKKIQTGVNKKYLMRYLRMLCIPALYSMPSVFIAESNYSNNVILDLMYTIRFSFINEIITF